MKYKRKDYLKVIGALLFAAIIVFILLRYRHMLMLRLGHHIHVKDIKRFILSYGKFSSLCFVILYGLKPILFVVPASLLSILAGNIFGPYMALLLSMSGCFIAGTLAFVLAKALGRSFIENLLKGKALSLDENIEKHGFKIMLLMRLSFIFPYDPLSFAAGLTKMKYRDFILGTLLGVFPEMISYSFMGENLQHPLSLSFVFPIIFIILVALLGSYAYKLYKNKHK
jgi:uncharacterized membrane protein YdjX (TVP38/TMEM64 family)